MERLLKKLTAMAEEALPLARGHRRQKASEAILEARRLLEFFENPELERPPTFEHDCAKALLDFAKAGVLD